MITPGLGDRMMHTSYHYHIHNSLTLHHSFFWVIADLVVWVKGLERVDKRGNEQNYVSYRRRTPVVL